MKHATRLLCIFGLIGSIAMEAKKDNGCCCKVSAHTAFTVMPQYQTATPERITGFRDRMYIRKDGCAGALQVVPFGGKSIHSSQMAKFFTPFCKNQLSVNSNFVQAYPNLLSEHFNVYPADVAPETPGVFTSDICLKAWQSVAGVGITYKQGVWELPWGNNLLWFELSAPIIHVHNKVELHEAVDPKNSPLLDDKLPHNMTEAFKQPAWCYGKIDDCKAMRKTGLADLEIKLGYQWVINDCCFFESFIGLLAPTGNKPRAEYIFEPIVGFNRHFGGEVGMTGVFQFWESCHHNFTLAFALDMNAWYFVKANERRSFDLKQRPWSRYMQTYANKQQAQYAADLAVTDPQQAYLINTPGINIFTRDLKVSPRMSKMVNSAVILNACRAQFEVGYNFYTRQAECVQLACPWQEGPALKDIHLGNGYTNPMQSINRVGVGLDNSQPLPIGDYNNNLIKESDLDLESAAHPGFITNTLYASFLWRWDDLRYPCLVGLGGSFEYSDDNTYMSRWLSWFKVGFSF